MTTMDGSSENGARPIGGDRHPEDRTRQCCAEAAGGQVSSGDVDDLALGPLSEGFSGRDVGKAMAGLAAFVRETASGSTIREQEVCRKFIALCREVLGVHSAVYVVDTGLRARLLGSSLENALPSMICLDPKLGNTETRGDLIPWSPHQISASESVEERQTGRPDDSHGLRKFDGKSYMIPLLVQEEFLGAVWVSGDPMRLEDLCVQKCLQAASSYLALALWVAEELRPLREWEQTGQEASTGEGTREAVTVVNSESGFRALYPPTRFEAEFGLVGRSPEFLDMLERAWRWAQADNTVLIIGETGTGKELVARLIHKASKRKDAPWVTVNCPAIPGELAESELFGHERGAFTGATEARPGKFELADGGTLFLDEIGDLPLAIQAKLLRVLQEGEIERVGGGGRVRRVDVRVIAATNRDLWEAVEGSDFRRDFFFRLYGLPLLVPPLRDRLGDVELLAWYFLDRAAARYDKRVSGFTVVAMEALCQYRWPGNVRELQQLIDRAVLLSRQPVICSDDIADLGNLSTARPPTLHAQLRQEKQRRVELALRLHRGNCSKAARDFGMSRANFARLLRALGVNPRKFRDRGPNTSSGG